MKHLDTFVQYKPRHTIIFMEVLEVTDTIDTKEICNVSWYMVCKDEIIIQSDFPMCATDGEFVNFVPIPRHSFLEARRLIKKIRKEQMFVPKNDKTAPSEFKQAYRKARRKIIQIIKKIDFFLVFLSLFSVKNRTFAAWSCGCLWMLIFEFA